MIVHAKDVEIQIRRYTTICTRMETMQTEKEHVQGQLGIASLYYLHVKYKK